MTSIARNPTEMATKNIKKKKWQPKNKQMQTQKKRGEYKIFVGLIKIPCKFVYGDYCGRNPHHPHFTVMRSCVCVCVFCGNNCFDCAAKEWRKISENLTKSYFICARQNSRATTPPKKKRTSRAKDFFQSRT